MKKTYSRDSYNRKTNPTRNPNEEGNISENILEKDNHNTPKVQTSRGETLEGRDSSDTIEIVSLEDKKTYSRNFKFRNCGF